MIIGCGQFGSVVGIVGILLNGKRHLIVCGIDGYSHVSVMIKSIQYSLYH